MSAQRQRLVLAGLLALFMGPVVLVVLMRSSWWQYQPSGLTNHGHLVQPPVALPLALERRLDGQWLILHVLDEPCGAGCVERVTALRQVHRAAGREGGHLSVVLLSKSGAGAELRSRLKAIYPEFRFAGEPVAATAAALAGINSGLQQDGARPDSVRTYLLDPMRNVVLAYESSADPGDIHKDLKRLLKWSVKEDAP